MKTSARICLLFVSLLAVLTIPAQAIFPTSDGERIRYAASIEMPRGWVSGTCVLKKDSDTVRGSLFNEFGFTAIDFCYYPQRRKVKLVSVMDLLDKWYIRRVLRKDLARLLERLQQGDTQYRNDCKRITYQFTPIGQ